QHPWFVESRSKPQGAKQDWYVWSDTDQRYRDTRIIFTDTESSNWAWDNERRLYYWHRFFSHQPDLNWDNPQVFRAVMRVMNFWLELGVDGLRLEAVHYLMGREGRGREKVRERAEGMKSKRTAMEGEGAETSTDAREKVTRDGMQH